MSLINFVNDNKIWGYCELEDKMIIKSVITLYSSLITGQFVHPAVDSVQLERMTREMRRTKSEKDNLSIDNKPTTSLFRRENFDVIAIKKQIDSKFKKDNQGNYTDLAGVLADLAALAQKDNDPKIAELYYFDETEGKFKWQE